MNNNIISFNYILFATKSFPTLNYSLFDYFNDNAEKKNNWNKYVKDNLIFQLDIANPPVNNIWKDCNSKSKLQATITGNYIISDGLVFENQGTINLPVLDDSKYYEICQLTSDGDFVVNIYNSSVPSQIDITGTLYSIRVYSVILTEEQHNINYIIDNDRFNIPSTALWLGADDTLMLGEDYLCIE